jgi:predicted DNA-binding transcriptional regulator AlpA
MKPRAVTRFKMSKYRLVPAHERAGLSREEAAEFIGVSPTLFDEMVKDGRMPPPKMINSRRVWWRLGLEKAFVGLPEVGGPQDSPWLDCA